MVANLWGPQGRTSEGSKTSVAGRPWALGASPHTPLAQLGPKGSRESARAGAEEGVVPMTGRKPGDAGSSRRPGASATPEQPKVRAAPGLEEARSPQRAALERPPVPTHGLGQSLTGGETTDSRRLRQRRGSVSSAGSCSCRRRARSIPTPTTPPPGPPPRAASAATASAAAPAHFSASAAAAARGLRGSLPGWPRATAVASASR